MQRAPRELDSARHRELAKQFVQKVKGRFPPSVYLQFLKILRDFEDKQATITEVEDKLSVLFHGHNDLLEEFGTFLPDDMRGKALKRKEDTDEEEETDCGVIDSEVIASCARTQTCTQNLAIDKRSISALLWTTVCVLTRMRELCPTRGARGRCWRTSPRRTGERATRSSASVVLAC